MADESTMKLSVVVEAAVGSAKKSIEDFRDSIAAVGVEAQKTSDISADAAASQQKGYNSLAASGRTLQQIINAQNAAMSGGAKVFVASAAAESSAIKSTAAAAQTAVFGHVALAAASEVAAAGANKVAHSSSAARRELIVLAHEAATGNYSRFGGSLSVLAERLDLLGAITSPVGIAIAGLTAIVGTAAYAMLKGSAEVTQFNNDLRLTGDVAGVTLGQFNAMAEGVSTATNGHIAEARNVIQTLIATGRFTSASLGSVARAIIDVADASGEEVPKITTDFAKMADGVAKWAVEANHQYHFLTLAQYEHIRALEQQGNLEEAAAVTSQLLSQQLEKQKEPLGTLPALWHSLGVEINTAWNNLKKWGKPETIDDQIAAQQQAIDNLKKVLENNGTPGVSTLNDKGRAQIQAQMQQEMAKFQSLMDQKAGGEKTAQQDSADKLEQQRLIDQSNKLQSLREAAAGREMAWRIAHLQAVAELQKANDNAERTQLESKLKTGEISYAAYYARLAALSKGENNAQIQALQAQLGQNSEKRSATAARPAKDDADKLETASKLNEIDAEREAIQGRINVLQAESGNLQSDAVAKSSSAIEELRRKVEEASAQLQSISSSLAPADLPARMDAIANQVRTKYSTLQKEVAANADALKAKGVDVDVVIKLIGAETTKDQVDAQIDTIEKNVAAAQARFQNQQVISATNVETGNTTKAQARGQVQGAAGVDVAALTQARTQVLALLNDYPDNPKLAEVLKGINSDIKDVEHISDSPFQTLIQNWADTTSQLKNASASFAQGFADQITNLVTKGKADFRGLATSILSDLAKILVQKELAGIVNLAVDGFGSAFGGTPAIGVFSSSTGAPGYATGGHVRGSGSGTSDSIPAFLSNGEYVVKADAVKRVGTRLLDSINGGQVMAARAAHYSSGGLVTTSAASPAAMSTGNNVGINVSVPVNVGGRAIGPDDVQRLQIAMAPAMANTARAIILEQQRDGGSLASLRQ